MSDGALGKQYEDGEVVCRQGEAGDRMFVMQAGRAVVSHEEEGREIVLGEMTAGDIFGEMAIFDREPRSATVRASGDARILTLDRIGFLKRVHEDPSLAYRILRAMSHRIRALTTDVSRARLEPGERAHHVVVVARPHTDVFLNLAHDFAAVPSVAVVLDRRAGQRRRQRACRSPERRGTDRRRQPNLDERLRIDGVVIGCSFRGC